ncbi:AAA family ATPase [Streptomyces sp. SID3343]|uniref:AAA family ATPase n=1 Tax=Streptomyces sp. SID3343 TaxID=2690260 RepID=UPI001370E848|nr:AAA family ATPase [Streptomyces sp. SID3343]MYW03485.1 AAA family ATPase [Streptomyces sp. SID3343]
MSDPEDYQPDELSPVDRMEPHDIDAEQALLGCCLIYRHAVRDVLRTVQPSDLYRPAHETVLRAMLRLDEQGESINAHTVVAELQAAGDLARVGGPPYIHTLAASPPPAADASWYIRRIRALSLRRAVVRAGISIAQLGYGTAGRSDDLAERAVTITRDVRDRGRASEDVGVQDIHDFLQVEDDEPDWVLPGYLERGDRVIWTAGEGGGKSVLLRQIAVATAAGVLPFGKEPNTLGPKRVLVLDCENSEAQSRRRYRSLMDTAERIHHPVKRGQLHIHCRPEGVDLTRADGRAWLMRRVEDVMPDLLVIGPIYQLHTGDPNSEEHARKVTLALTEARVTAGCALVMEAHAAKASGFGPRGLAPVGSSLWLRWPEFGMGLRPVEDTRSAEEDRARRIVPWRGARDERNWPRFIRGGWTTQGEWPWTPYMPVDADRNGRSDTGALS